MVTKALQGNRSKPQPERQTANSFGDYRTVSILRVRTCFFWETSDRRLTQQYSWKIESEWWATPASSHRSGAPEETSDLGSRRGDELLGRIRRTPRGPHFIPVAGLGHANHID